MRGRADCEEVLNNVDFASAIIMWILSVWGDWWDYSKIGSASSVALAMEWQARTRGRVELRWTGIVAVAHYSSSEGKRDPTRIGGGW